MDSAVLDMNPKCLSPLVFYPQKFGPQKCLPNFGFAHLGIRPFDFGFGNLQLKFPFWLRSVMAKPLAKIVAQTRLVVVGVVKS